MGDGYLAVDDKYKAIDAFKRAAKLAPDDNFTWSQLARAYQKAGMKSEAAFATQQQIAALKTELQVHPEWGFLWSSLGDACDEVDNRADATKAYEQAVIYLTQIKRPTNGSEWASLGDVYRKLGKFTEAVDAYVRALRLEPKNALYELKYWETLNLIPQEAIRAKKSAENNKSLVETSLPERPLPTDSSLPNGTVLSHFAGSGGGTFTIINDSTKDAFVKVVDPNAHRRYSTFYVKASSSYSLKAVPDGKFAIFFATGFDWDGDWQTFKRSAVYSRFDNLVDFATTQRREGDYMVTYTAKNSITLKPVRSGNAKTSAISAEEFNKN